MSVAADDLDARLALGGLVKICGIREPEHAVAAVAAGADLIGFIFAQARRQVTPQHARACISAARRAAGGNRILAVGVFVDAGVDEIAAIIATAGLDVVQLQGEETPEQIGQIEAPVTKAFRPRPGESAADLVANIERYTRADVPPAAVLIDAYVPGEAGGSGVAADWDLARRVGEVCPMMLGGGLHGGNVAEAIGLVRPLGVDVSSGVETAGVKDPEKIAAFIAAARQGFGGELAEARRC